MKLDFRNSFIILNLILMLFITSCNNESINENELKPILSAFSQDTSIIIENNLRIYQHFAKQIDYHWYKFWPYYSAVKQIKESSFNLRNFIKINENDKSLKDSIVKYSNALNIITDSFKINKSVLNSFDSLQSNLINLRNQDKISDILFVILLQNGILVTEYKLNKEMLYRISSFERGYFHPLRVRVLDDFKDIKRGQYYFAYITTQFMDEQTNLDFKIDFISHNGKKINPRINTKWVNGVGELKIYPYETGWYLYTGRVIYNDPVIGGKSSSPFSGKFYVKEE